LWGYVFLKTHPPTPGVPGAAPPRPAPPPPPRPGRARPLIYESRIRQCKINLANRSELRLVKETIAYVADALVLRVWGYRVTGRRPTDRLVWHGKCAATVMMIVEPGVTALIWPARPDIEKSFGVTNLPARSAQLRRWTIRRASLGLSYGGDWC
jgi:hypothetical protein